MIYSQQRYDGVGKERRGGGADERGGAGFWGVGGGWLQERALAGGASRVWHLMNTALWRNGLYRCGAESA